MSESSTSPTTATFGVVCASAIANAACDCSSGNDRGVANGGGVLSADNESHRLHEWKETWVA